MFTFLKAEWEAERGKVGELEHLVDGKNADPLLDIEERFEVLVESNTALFIILPPFAAVSPGSLKYHGSLRRIETTPLPASRLGTSS
jgi:hypothetical protein